MMLTAGRGAVVFAVGAMVGVCVVAWLGVDRGELIATIALGLAALAELYLDG